ncbi:aminopeptidase P family protein [Adhaeribacter radiodurans]|uniref:Xaa-Pro aminopeptidase n=1 Tax=Adhaeribacter radiodurans TaxID=2745197 RepID=A0A7L7L2A4_9BACT|nr:aminopeptidase P family protein [Adhaeribacter radiodurans]QMU26926.1 aminopeptidase P family protein [Adhaeribacter radiodurans]
MYFSKQDIEQRRQRLAVKWDALLQPDEAVLVYSGDLIFKPGGLDQTYSFLPHPAYYWLTGRRREEEVILYNKNLGWVEFQKIIPAGDAVWEGERNDLLVSEKGNAITELNSFLVNNKFAQVYKLGQVPGGVTGKAFDLRTALDQTRRAKDNSEINLIKHLAQIATQGYTKIKEVLQPGITEKDIQVAYEGEILRRGAHTVPYDTIVGSGVNSAILHALPTQKVIQENVFVLVDAGCDIYDYCVDITRMFPASRNISSQHKALYQLVLQAHTECIALSKPGVFWRDVHNHAAKVLTEGLLQLGILKGNLSTLLEKEVVSVFFPHGLGHLVGLRVRDTGQEENLNPKTYFGARLRVDIELVENYLITVEPGCYFIKPLLENSEIQNKFKEDISWSEVDKWKHIGGVRIEDNILITQNGNENLTIDVPKSSEF